jgi:signal transduction histidine kinase
MRAGKDPINVKINLDLDENIGMVPLFPEDFSRVILNLCKNAFDAMRDKTRLPQDGNYLPTLNITSKANGNRLHLTFEDNGPGISEENRKKLFEPFFTTKKGTEGTSLGLSITHDIIAKHQGSIDITSETGQFARFTIELPLTQQD